MISHSFGYEAPGSIDRAVALLSELGADAAVSGGGTWLVPNMTYGRHRPSVVVDVKRLNLDTITESNSQLVVGAGATYADVMASATARETAPLLVTMASQITGGPQIVGQGTLGGSACYANPSSDVPACLVALDAELRLLSSRGPRYVAASDFFLGPFVTDRRADEILTEIRIPRPADLRSSGYFKLKFSTGSWPIVTAACLATRSTSSRLKLRIAVGAANEIPVVFEADINRQTAFDEVAAVAQRVTPLITREVCDEFAGTGYRRKVAPAIAARAIRAALAERLS